MQQRPRRALLSIVLAPVLLACECSAGGTDGATATSPSLVLGVAMVLVCLSMGFERLEHLIKHIASEHTMPVVAALFRELTILGASA